MSTLQLITQVVPMESGGILDWLGAKNASTQSLFRALSITAGIGFVLYQAIVSRGALARVIVSGIAAAVFIWIVHNVTDVSDRVNNEVNTMPAPTSIAHTPPIDPAHLANEV